MYLMRSNSIKFRKMPVWYNLDQTIHFHTSISTIITVAEEIWITYQLRGKFLKYLFISTNFFIPSLITYPPCNWKDNLHVIWGYYTKHRYPRWQHNKHTPTSKREIHLVIEFQVSTRTIILVDHVQLHVTWDTDINFRTVAKNIFCGRE